MDPALKYMLTEINIRECLSKESETEKALIIFQMDRYIKESGIMERSRDSASVNGQMEKSMKVNGWTIEKMEWDSSNGPMVDNIVALIETIRSTVKEPTFGMMEGNILGSGRMTSGMEKVNMSSVIIKARKEFGNKIRGLNGLTNERLMQN